AAPPRIGHRPRPPLARGRRLPDRRHRSLAVAEGSQARAAEAAATRKGEKREVISARNRELVALVPVALLLTAGFAAVFAQENVRVNDLSLIYGAYFFAVCLATHIYIRLRLPDADPYLFPLCALLTAFGLVMIYRINEDLARDQANWFVLGLVL